MQPMPLGATDIALAVRSSRPATLARMTSYASEARSAIERLAAHADRLPCIVFLGERNSGKSTAANRLIGAGLLPTNVVVSTRHPTLVRHAARPTLHAVTMDGRRVEIATESDAETLSIDLLEVGLPIASLERFQVLDTPAGFDPATLSELPLGSAPIVPVWCTMATQAWKASERFAWAALDARFRRNAILAVTAIDRLDERTDRERLMNRLLSETASLFRSHCWTGNAADHESGNPADDERDLALTAPMAARILHARRKQTATRLTGRLERLAALLDPCADTGEPLPAFLDSRQPANRAGAISGDARAVT